MEIKNKRIDGGKAFDWGKTSSDYAKYRDIYPDEFYKKIIDRNLCVKGQRVLDLGTGTGVLPRNLYKYGAEWVGADISENQILAAKALSAEQGMDIDYYAVAAEDLPFDNNSFDVITACQCYWYFDFKKLTPILARLLKKDGRILFLVMNWLPFEDKIALESEKLVLKYSPKWTGAKHTLEPVSPNSEIYTMFEKTHSEEYFLDIPFTRESWHGRMRACRGVGASLSEKEIENWETEHKALLEKIAPPEFTIKHYAAILELKKK